MSKEKKYQVGFKSGDSIIVSEFVVLKIREGAAKLDNVVRHEKCYYWFSETDDSPPYLLINLVDISYIQLK